MKKKQQLTVLLSILFTVAILLSACKSDRQEDPISSNSDESNPVTSNEQKDSLQNEDVAKQEPDPKEKIVITPEDKDSIVAKYGQLQVIGTQLSDQDGNPVQLKGLSTHGLQYSGSLVNKEVITFLKDDWHMQLYRSAMYIEENGYATSKYVQTKMEEAIKACVELGLYVIIDWHILQDNNPQFHKDLAKDFFAEMAEKYGDYPNVIYEICNEPNGSDVTWDEDIKPYAEEIIPVIRQHDPDSIIIVGTSTYSQDVDIAAKNPLDFKNIMYTLHFYAGTHGDELREKAQKALDAGLPLFVTEWGTTLASGTGGVYEDKTKEWLKFLDENRISNSNWCISNQYQDSSILKPKTSVNGGWTADNYTESGKFIRSYLLGEIKY